MKTFTKERRLAIQEIAADAVRDAAQSTNPGQSAVATVKAMQAVTESVLLLGAILEPTLDRIMEFDEHPDAANILKRECCRCGRTFNRNAEYIYLHCNACDHELDKEKADTTNPKG